MTRIFLIRHGYVDNPKDLLYGRLPGFPLNEHGRWQAQYHADRFLKAGIRIANIYTSPLERARQTATLIGDALNLPVTEDDRLTEWGEGFWEGRPMKQFREQSGYYESPMQMHGLEPHDQVVQRMFAVVQDLLRDYPNQISCIVSHRESLASLLIWLQKRPWESIHDLDLPPGGAWEVCFDGDRFVSAELAWKAG